MLKIFSFAPKFEVGGPGSISFAEKQRGRERRPWGTQKAQQTCLNTARGMCSCVC